MRAKKNSVVVNRVLRGGSVDYGPGGLRSSIRNWYTPENRFWYFGFRIVVRKKA